MRPHNLESLQLTPSIGDGQRGASRRSTAVDGIQLTTVIGPLSHQLRSSRAALSSTDTGFRQSQSAQYFWPRVLGIANDWLRTQMIAVVTHFVRKFQSVQRFSTSLHQTRNFCSNACHINLTKHFAYRPMFSRSSNVLLQSRRPGLSSASCAASQLERVGEQDALNSGVFRGYRSTGRSPSIFVPGFMTDVLFIKTCRHSALRERSCLLPRAAGRVGQRRSIGWRKTLIISRAMAGLNPQDAQGRAKA